MDTLKTAKIDVSAKVEEIKVHMPKTYEWIQEHAVKMGNLAYELVRRGLRGERGCFYARERIRQDGKLDRWLVAGCDDGIPGLEPEALNRELNAPDMIELIFVLRDPAADGGAGACTKA